MKKVFITGITGQDGAWLSKLLLEKGYDVHGGVRRIVNRHYSNLDFLKIKDDIKIVDFDLIDTTNIYRLVSENQYDEIYNLAAQSFVETSFKEPQASFQYNLMPVVNFLDAICKYSRNTKFYQACTSEMFGKVQTIPQNEKTPFYPRSPYGIAKLAAYWSVVNFRESYDIFACSGILFNHESEIRGSEFVTRKISMHAASWANNQKGKLLSLGNLYAKRDWGYAREYVEGMWQMLQQNTPEDYVLATGTTSSIKEFCELCFKEVGIEITWEGVNESEIGLNSLTREKIIEINPKYYRPTEVDLLIGDSTKAETKLGWKARTDIKQLAKIMVENDISLL